MSPARKPSRLRVVGGRWRGRALPVPDADGLRPTVDRVREQLFNWLQGRLDGARCLDLFAGSGALGIEAASRGAAQVVLVESNVAVARQLEDTLARLQSGEDTPLCRCVCSTAARFVASNTSTWHVVFLDPPFDHPLSEQALADIDALVADGGWVYHETRHGDPALTLPARWQSHRAGRAGEAAYQLYQVAECPTG